MRTLIEGDLQDLYFAMTSQRADAAAFSVFSPEGNVRGKLA